MKKANIVINILLGLVLAAPTLSYGLDNPVHERRKELKTKKKEVYGPKKRAPRPQPPAETESKGLSPAETIEVSPDKKEVRDGKEVSAEEAAVRKSFQTVLKREPTPLELKMYLERYSQGMTIEELNQELSEHVTEKPKEEK